MAVVKLNLMVFLICINILCGCAVNSNVMPQNYTSFDNLSNTYPHDAQDLAQETAKELGNYYPDKSTIKIAISQGIFGDSLMQSLRQNGFNPSFSKSNNVSYIVDILGVEDGVQTQAYVQVRLIDLPNISGLAGEHFFSISQELKAMPLQHFSQYNDNYQEDSTYLKQNTITPIKSLSSTPITKNSSAALSLPLSKSLDGKMPSLPSASAVLPKPVIAKALESIKDMKTMPPTYAPLIVLKTWRLERGPLRPQLMLWSEQSGYQLVWKASNDFSMETASKFNGKFLEAMEKLFAALLQSGGHALRVTVYEANKVITISEN